ncbi:MAG: SDR family oxidoreductase [Myxococcales bacterium]|nr:SDR family oxidoreductase [Polyangiaceae bacterium]MDW8248641.1 SDR family oxidoreductase [Myxococcales bacterium]
MRPPLEGVVLVTGASSGIGRALAREVAPRCCALVLVARRKSKLEALAHELRERHPKLQVLVAPCDITDRIQIDEMLLDVQRAFGVVDVLINNAGFGDMSLFDLSDWDRNQRMIDLNATALAYLTHRLVGPMVERGRGGILNISSGLGLSFLPGFTTYIATKHFVTGFTEALRLDLAGTGVVVTQSCPGPVATEFASHTGNFTGREIPAFLEISAEQCARESLRAFELDRALVIPGVVTWLLMFFHHLSPRPLRRLLLSSLGPHLRQLQNKARTGSP